MKINRHFLELSESYLFSEISRRVASFQEAHPARRLIRMGIGDVTRPLAPAVVEALQRASAELSEQATFRGYGPEQGYPFLREAIRADYAARGVRLSPEEIFVGDGAKSDLGNILDLFSADNTVLIPDPVYPVYVDTNRMAGRRIVFLDANEQNGFLPTPEGAPHTDIVYLCSPNNPTGAAYGREGLQAWVEYALREGAVLLFDAAYEAFIRSPGLPRSIYEIEGADRCAIEFCSLSKTAGFTGLRCGWTVVPAALEADGVPLKKLWLRRQTTKFNGVSYPVQRAAEAVFTVDGYGQVQATLEFYRENARLLADALRRGGIWFTGGENSPYLWMKCPAGTDSWQYFDLLLEGPGIVGTPGAGFGKNGEGFFRLTAFGSREDTAAAAAALERFAAG